MAKILPDERSVYLAFKNIFKGPDAQLRNGKKIMKKIVQYKDENDEIRALILEHNIDHIHNVIRGLLDAEIFESTLEAKIRFPEVFDVSPAQSAERAVSEAEAARTAADAIRDALGAQQGESIPAALSSFVHDKVHHPKISNDGATLPVSAEKDLTAHPPPYKPLHSESRATQSLYPLYLSAKSQRRLLSKVQDILELACYAFAREMMRDEVHKRGWESPDCVELNTWMGLFKRHLSLFDVDRVRSFGKSLPDLFDSIAQIRHTAVHRPQITTGQLEIFLADAEALTVLLAHGPHIQRLSSWRRKTGLVIEEFGRNKDLLELQYLEKCKEIAAQRVELDRIEKVAWQSMVEEDKQYQSFAGASIEQLIDVPETVTPCAANSDTGGTSEEDMNGNEGETEFCRID